MLTTAVFYDPGPPLLFLSGWFRKTAQLLPLPFHWKNSGFPGTLVIQLELDVITWKDATFKKQNTMSISMAA